MKTPPAALAAVLLIACSGKGAEKARPATGTEAIAEVVAAKSLPTEKFVSTTAGFDLELPGVWHGRYRAEEKKDTTAGAQLAVDFKFVPDSGSRAPSLNLMTVRVFPRAAWEAASKRPGRPVGVKIGENAKQVFTLSLPESNPYPPQSPEAPAYDRLIISVAQGGQQVHLTAR
jgi:hypothetical protein